MPAVEFRQLTKHFGLTTILHGLDLQIESGEFIVLVGPSGCGKSTLLRLLAGLDDISAGELLIKGERANDVPAQHRNMAMVFQSYALYPHLSVFENIAFGPKTRGEKPDDYLPRIRQAAAILNLTHCMDRLPKALSGGQRQRVAMGRAVVRDTDLFLFDEPLSNLDAQLRVQMRSEIKALHQRLGCTVVYVTHDQTEAMTMADRIVVMRAGRIEQVGRPLALYDQPVNRFVASFIGSPAMNFIAASATVREGHLHWDLDGGAQWRHPLDDHTRSWPLGTPLTLGVRPEHLTLATHGLPLRVTLVEHTGASAYVHGRPPGRDASADAGEDATWCVHVPGRIEVRLGQTVHVQPREAANLHAFDLAGGQRLGR